MLGLRLGLSVGGGGAVSKPILNQIDGAVAGYSLDRLTSSATSPIRVFRDSDMAEMDIGLIGNKLDTASLLTFAGEGSAFVVTWYDQSGNGNDAIQSVAANCPRIVNNGVLEEDSNGDVSMYFDGADDRLISATTTVYAQPNSIVIKHKNVDTLALYCLTDGIGGNRHKIATTATTYQLFAGSIALLLTPDISINIVSAIFNGANSSFYKNLNIVENLDFGTNAFRTDIIIGTRNGLGSEFYKGSISDLIVFNKALTQTEVTKLNSKL